MDGSDAEIIAKFTGTAMTTESLKFSPRPNKILSGKNQNVANDATLCHPKADKPT